MHRCNKRRRKWEQWWRFGVDGDDITSPVLYQHMWTAAADVKCIFLFLCVVCSLVNFFLTSVDFFFHSFGCFVFVVGFFFWCTSLTMMLHSVFNWMSFKVLPSKQCIFRVLLRVFFLLVCFIRPQFTISASVAENSDFVFHHWIKLTSDRLNVRILGSLFRSFFFSLLQSDYYV